MRPKCKVLYGDFKKFVVNIAPQPILSCFPYRLFCKGFNMNGHLPADHTAPIDVAPARAGKRIAAYLI
ncbi:MAG TPA: hypothetical protein PLK27_10010, partial [Neisseria sp.]|nr:hypothetical protein [Neisseria sp.]